MAKKMARMSFTIPQEIMEDFKRSLVLEDMNASAVLRNLVLQWMRNKTKRYIYRGFQNEQEN